MGISELRSLPPALVAVIGLLVAVAVQVIMTLGRKGLGSVLHEGEDDSESPQSGLEKARAAANIILSLAILAILFVAIGGWGPRPESECISDSQEEMSVSTLELGLTPAISDLQSLVWEQGYRDSTSRARLIAAIAELKGNLLENAYIRVRELHSKGIRVVRYRVDVWFDGPRYQAEQVLNVCRVDGRTHVLEFPVVRSMQLKLAPDLGTGIEVTARPGGCQTAVLVPDAVKTFGDGKNNACYISCNLGSFDATGDSIEVTVRFRGEQDVPFSLGDTDIRPFLGGIDKLEVSYHFLNLPSDVKVGRLSAPPAVGVSFRDWSDGVGGWQRRPSSDLPWPDAFSLSGWSDRSQIRFEYARIRPSLEETPILFFWQDRPPA